MKNRDSIVEYTASPHLEIVGNNQCVVDGLKGILEYTKDKIKIDLGKYAVTFTGSELYINALSHEGAVVEGTIMSMEFCSND
ncbi:MAG: YabP/YqfC family sporulation protein [Eubacterium sp.]|nr:YabP/YqfC family sporulation protein [Eubacterium sp.]